MLSYYRLVAFALILAGTGMLLAPTPVAAQTSKIQTQDKPMALGLGTLSGRAKFATDYVINGISLSDNGPTASASLRWHAPEFANIAIPHILVWGASVDGVQGGLEIGYQAGITKITGRARLYLGANYFQYPAQDNAKTGPNNLGDGDFLEWQAALTHQLPLGSATLFYAYSGDGYGNSGPTHVVEFTSITPLPQLRDGLELFSQIGHIDRYEDKGAGRDYWHWDIGLIFRMRRLTLELHYTDTDLSRQACRSGKTYCDARATFSIAYGL